MTAPKMQILDATLDRVLAYAGNPPPFTFAGHVAQIGDRVVGLGGIYFAYGVRYAFSEMNDELRARRRDVARCFRFLERQLAKEPGPIFAIATEPSSPRLLSRIGFQPTGRSLDSGQIWMRA